MIDYSRYLNEKIKSIKPSGIRKFFDIASEMEDVISLSVGEPDFYTPWHIRDQAITALEKGRTRYTPNRGLAPMREEICRFMQRKYGVGYDPQTDVLVTVGGSEAIDLAMRCLINLGDEVLVPEPSFVCYVPIAQMAGGAPVVIETKAENDFRLTAQELEEKITDKTKLLILPFPNNPTGAIMERRDLEEVAEVVKRHDLIVLSDEIYGELTYGDNSHVSVAAIEGMKERTVVVSGLSKSHSMTGWRIGYAVGPSELIGAMTKLHQFAIMSAPTNSQYAAIEALKNGDSDIEEMRSQYDMRRRLMLDALRSMGLECFEPRGAFYLFPSIKCTGMTSMEFSEKLIYSKQVAVVPGDAFGQCGEGFLRISYSYSLKHINEAMERMKAFINEIR